MHKSMTRSVMGHLSSGPSLTGAYIHEQYSHLGIQVIIELLSSSIIKTNIPNIYRPIYQIYI